MMAYKIIDEDGNLVAGGFRCWQTAVNELPGLKINKLEKLEIVRE